MFSQKILAPTLPSTILYREQLSQILGKALGSNRDTDTPAPYRLVLLCAPAGYGKTTLLADTVRRLALPCCWYALERSDQQGATFFTTLLASIRKAFPHAGPGLDALLKESNTQDELSLKVALDALIDTLDAAIAEEHWLLALCNYQEVNESPLITNLVNHLLKRLPPQCLLVIESRALPDLELAALIAYHQIFGLGRESLRFTAQEVCALTRIQNLPAFSDEEAAQLVTTFDGWIAGMLLASRLGKASFEAFTPSYTFAQTATFTEHKHLLEFIMTEVFCHETAIYTLLKETSLLDQLVPAFCDALLGISSTAALLERAERQGLFVTCTYQDGKRVYHCHPVLRQLFQEELRQHEQETFRSLHRRIATLYYQAHDDQAALTSALDAQAHDLVAEILLEISQSLLDQGQSELVLRGLDSLPLPIIERHPRLLLIRANTYLRRGDAASARACFEKARPLVTSITSSENVLIRAELAIIHGKLLLQQGAYGLAQDNFQEALEWLPPHERRLRLLVHQQCGVCNILSGQPVHAGIIHFQQALQLCHTRHEAALAGELHHQLANAYMWAGNYTVAEHHRHYIRVLCNRLGQPQKIVNNLVGLGLLKVRQGLVEEAEATLQSVLQITRQSPRLASSQAYALVGLGELALTRQDIIQALRHLQEALDVARQLEDRYLLNDTLGMLSLAYLQLGERYTARALLDQMVLRANETGSYERILQQLVHGTILLVEQHYDEARKMLERVAQLTGESGIQWLQVQALLRLAVCCLALEQPSLAKSACQQVHDLNRQGNHEYCIQVELQTYPLLHSLFQESSTQEEHLEIRVLPAEHVCIRALGEPVVLLDGSPVTGWRRARAQELFFFLLESEHPLRKDKIIAALWPEFDEDEALNQTFRSTVYCVRQVLGEACLVYQAGFYQLDLQAVYGQVWYDVVAFAECERMARAALEEENDRQAQQEYQRMIELYHGKYVEAFYSDWCIARRDALHQSLMDARQQLALIAWKHEEWEESLHHWQHLLALDPCQETAHYGIMRCYARQGKRDLALRQYQHCRRELHEHLEAEPGPALQKFYQRLAHLQG